MAPTATGSKARWAPQARRKACMGCSWAAACGVQGRGHIVVAVHLQLVSGSEQQPLHAHTPSWFIIRSYRRFTIHVVCPSVRHVLVTLEMKVGSIKRYKFSALISDEKFNFRHHVDAKTSRVKVTELHQDTETFHSENRFT